MKRVLDYGPRYDARNEEYRVADILGKPRRDMSRYWWQGRILDQGREGACVGFGWTAELTAEPKAIHFPDVLSTEGYAHSIYKQAQLVDQWEGEDYEGTSVLAGAKVVKSRGFIQEYRWARTVDEIIDAVIQIGPVVIGIPWYESMYSTRPSGLVERPSGRAVGGHCLTITGYNPRTRLVKEGWLKPFEALRWQNSWGTVYGKRGNGFVKPEDLEWLFSQWGEACVPMGRLRFRP